MDIKLIILSLLFTVGATKAHAQKTSKFAYPESPGLLLNIETASIFYSKTENQSYTKFGAGIGVEYVFYDRGTSEFSCAPMISFWGANEELKTYRVENSIYYYRSTVLTGKISLNVPLMYKRQISPLWRIGIGYQPQFLLFTLKNQTIRGTSTTEIPDVQFNKTESSVIGFVGYRIDRRHQINLLGQYGISKVIQGATEPNCNALRLQISRGIFWL